MDNNDLNNNQNFNIYNNYPNDNFNSYPNNNLNNYSNNDFNSYPNNSYQNNYSNSNFEYNQNQNLNNNPNLIPKKKKKKPFIIRFLRNLLIFILIIALIVGGILFFRNRKRAKMYEELAKDVLVMNITEDFNKTLESLKLEESDIEGLTNYDKAMKGLYPIDGSDTDGDGLTDKEEIEVYHTDPLKISSSDDMIPDGYKVLNNLDLQSSYSIDDLQYGAFYSYDNITLKDKTVENSLANVYEIDGYSVQGVPADIVYAINDYVGKLDIDFSSYIKDKEYTIFSKKSDINAEYEILKDKNGVVSLNIKDTDGDLVVGLLNNSSISDVTFNNFIIDDFTINKQKGIYGNDAMMVVLPITGLFGNMKVYIWETSLFSEELNSRSDYLTQKFNEKYETDKFEVTHMYINPIQYGVMDKVFTSIANGKFYQSILNKMGESSKEFDDVVDDGSFSKIMQLFFLYSKMNKGLWMDTIDNNVNMEEDINKEEEIKPQRPSKYVTSFNLYKDTLPFPNMGTYISSGGNCAGFSLITAQLFNNNLYGKQGTAEYSGNSYNYNIDGVDEMDTFFDRYLNDYKNRNYWKETYGKTARLSRSEFSENDAKFLDFLGTKWAEQNEKANVKKSYWSEGLSWKDFENLKSYFENNDKIVTIGVFSNGSGHAINGYGVEQDTDNPNVWYILVYDNNFPEDKHGDAIGDLRIKVEYKKSIFGKEYFEWDYYPFPKELPKYRYNSYLKVTSGKGAIVNTIITVSQVHGLYATDENINHIF